jgi:hypothetical protein
MPVIIQPKVVQSMVRRQILTRREPSVRLDLRQEFAELYAHVADRVRGFKPDTNDGPGEPGPIQLIHVGYESSQLAWAVIVFDTRPDAAVDGEWNSYIEGNLLERPRWLEADEANLDGPITVVQLDGSVIELPAESELPALLGEFVTAVVVKARADGIFEPLPKGPNCRISIEHHEGAYGWMESASL